MLSEFDIKLVLHYQFFQIKKLRTDLMFPTNFHDFTVADLKNTQLGALRSK